MRGRKRESEAAKTNLDYEMEARANGYANNVDLARREYEEKLAIEQKAVEEKKRLEKVKEGIDTISQISSLITSSALIWQSAMAFGIPIGPILAATTTALMWGSFAASKIKAAQVANAKTYGEGGMEFEHGVRTRHDIGNSCSRHRGYQQRQQGRHCQIYHQYLQRKYQTGNRRLENACNRTGSTTSHQ